MIEDARRLRLDSRLEECEQEAEARVEPDLLPGDVELAVDAGALKTEDVSVPGVVEVEVLLELLRHPLGVLARLGERPRVAAADVDIVHRSPLLADLAAPILAERAPRTRC